MFVLVPLVYLWGPTYKTTLINLCTPNSPTIWAHEAPWASRLVKSSDKLSHPSCFSHSPKIVSHKCAKCSRKNKHLIECNRANLRHWSVFAVYVLLTCGAQDCQPEGENTGPQWWCEQSEALGGPWASHTILARRLGLIPDQWDCTYQSPPRQTIDSLKSSRVLGSDNLKTYIWGHHSQKQ